MKLAIKDTTGADQGELEAKFTPVDDDKGQQAVHEAVVAYNAAQRSGTASTKTVAEVAGSGKKPWRQKGTGRARVGYKRNPIWRGGGVAHGPKPRVYIKKLNKKVRDLTVLKVHRARQGRPGADRRRVEPGETGDSRVGQNTQRIGR